MAAEGITSLFRAYIGEESLHREPLKINHDSLGCSWPLRVPGLMEIDHRQPKGCPDEETGPEKPRLARVRNADSSPRANGSCRITLRLSVGERKGAKLAGGHTSSRATSAEAAWIPEEHCRGRDTPGPVTSAARYE